MTVEALPWAIHGQSHNATVARNALAAIMGAPAAALTAGSSITTAGGSHGVVGGSDLAVTQNGTPNMSVNVAAGRAIIRGTETASALQGAYTFINDGTVNLTIAAADATNPRRDLVVAQVRDANYAGASNDARLAVITGTPAGVPADPAVPNSCIVLARVAVAAAATSILTANITDLRTFATAVGGVQRCLSTGRPTGASLYEGLYIDEADTDRLMRYDGSAWTIAGGRRPRVTVTRSAGQVLSTGVNTAITWDTESVDTDGIHSTSSNTSRLTVPAGLAGMWAIGYVIEWSSPAAAGQRVCWVSINGATGTRLAYSASPTVATTDTPALTGFCLLPLAVGDYVEVYGFQNSGASASAATSANSTFNAMHVGLS